MCVLETGGLGLAALQSPPDDGAEALPRSSLSCEALVLGRSAGEDGSGVLACAAPGEALEEGTEVDEFLAQDLTKGCEGLGLGRATPNAIEGDPSGLTDCETDEDCPEGASCVADSQGSQCRLPPECDSAADCGAGNQCFCAAEFRGSGGSTPYSAFNQCLPAECQRAEDCGAFSCGVSYATCEGFTGAYCHTAEDECTRTSDCGDDETCAFSPQDGHWVCSVLTTCG